MLAFKYVPAFTLIRFILIPSILLAFGCGAALHHAVRYKAPVRSRLILGIVGAAGVALFLFFVIKIYVLSYWED